MPKRPADPIGAPDAKRRGLERRELEEARATIAELEDKLKSAVSAVYSLQADYRSLNGHSAFDHALKPCRECGQVTFPRERTKCGVCPPLCSACAGKAPRVAECVECGGSSCPCAAVHCDSCKAPHCLECAPEKCALCDQALCHECEVACKVCKEVLCGECHLLACASCVEVSFCGKCAPECADCGEVVCESCSATHAAFNHPESSED